MLTAGACHGGKPAVIEEYDARLYGKVFQFHLAVHHHAVGSHIVRALPGLAHIIGIFKVEAPAVFLDARRGYESALAHHGLVLHRTQIVFLQRHALRPRLSSVLGAHHPTRPVAHALADLEVYHEVSARYLINHGVPASFAQRVVEHSVCHHLRCSPCVLALQLATHPDADIGVSLLCSAEICCHEVALRCLGDGCRMTFGERCLGIKELIGNDARISLRQLFGE